MKPTNKLRWLVRSPHQQDVLQQWWEKNVLDKTLAEIKSGVYGEWRDVPVEVEQ